MQTEEQARLTLEQVERELAEAVSGWNACVYGGDFGVWARVHGTELMDMGRALRASQTALRRFEWEKHGEGDMEINFCPTCRGVKPWHAPSCEMRAALLDQGDGDAS